VPPASSIGFLKDGCNIYRVACSKVARCGTRHQRGEWQEIPLTLTLARALPSFFEPGQILVLDWRAHQLAGSFGLGRGTDHPKSFGNWPKRAETIEIAQGRSQKVD